MNTIANRNALSRHVASLALLSSFAVFVALGNATAVAQGMQLYRWVDEQGNVNYTDKIPASQAEKGHIELSDDGMRVRTIPPAKTAEQIQRERELERLRALIRPYLAQGHPPLSLVAEIVGMSERTLQRRLAQSGTSYSDSVQQARFSIASDLLADSDLNIADIAFAAGYENAPHFSRAFKRLTGMTPRDYRCGLA